MKIVLTGGGTGGHVFPAINIGNYLKNHYDAELFYIGNSDHIEKKLAEKENIPFYSISSQGLEGETPIKKYVGFVTKNTKGVLQAKKILQEIKPDFVIGTGGFVSAPTLAAAKILNIPFAIHEQNSVLGKVNKLFENMTEFSFHTFPIKEEGNKIYSGIPIRFKEKLEKNGESVVFLGGSGGSIFLNETAIEFAKNNPDVSVVLQAGVNNYEAVMASGVTKNLEVIAYTNDMMDLYKKAKVVVARSGAGTVFEIANLGISSVFVPLPNSADDHQKKNAMYFSDKNAAILVEQKDNFYENLSREVLALYKKEEKREMLKKNMENLAVRESESIIAANILKRLKNNNV